MRYFRTGDIGQILHNGNLQIIDRKKDLWKGPQGEYVALSKVESALKNSQYTQIPMCYGKTGGDWPIALICPQMLAIVKLGQELGVNEEYEALFKNPLVLRAVTEDCLNKCTMAKLQRFEMPQKIVLISEEWTPENDMLTAAMKLKRPLIAAKHKAEINAAYS